MLDQETAGRKRLSEAVRRRRAELGLAMDKLPDGPGEVTLRRIESADTEGGYRSKTLMQLDRSLCWKLGTSQGILDGTTPDNPSVGVVGHATLGRSVSDTAEARDFVTRSVSLGRSVSDTAEARDSAGVRTGGPEQGVSTEEAPRWTVMSKEPEARAVLRGARPIDPVSVITRAGMDFIDAMQAHHGSTPEVAEVRQAVLKYLQGLLVDELSDDPEKV